MAAETTQVDRQRLFRGICLALIPTGASFALVSNILGQLKQEFILTNYQVGLIGGAALWGMAISLLVLGPMLDRRLRAAIWRSIRSTRLG
jgi:MFS family permease